MFRWVIVSRQLHFHIYYFYVGWYAPNPFNVLALSEEYCRLFALSLNLLKEHILYMFLNLQQNEEEYYFYQSEPSVRQYLILSILCHQ
jgi:hypothetical protein